MMRVLLLSLVMSLSAGSALAAGNSNPWMRVCRIDGGLFYNLTGSEDYVMCFFDNAGVGAEAFFKFKTKGGDTLALKAYRNQNVTADADQVCAASGAQSVEGSDDQGQTFELCKFRDGSLIDAATLSSGPGAPGNEKLDAALQSTY